MSFKTPRTINILLPSSDGSKILVMNASNVLISISKGAIIARFEFLKDEEESDSAIAVNAILNVNDTGATIEVGDDLNEQQVREVKS